MAAEYLPQSKKWQGYRTAAATIDIFVIKYNNLFLYLENHFKHHMDVNFPEYLRKSHRDEQVKLQILQPKLGSEAVLQNETDSWRYIQTVQPNQPLQVEFCQKGMRICKKYELNNIKYLTDF